MKLINFFRRETPAVITEPKPVLPHLQAPDEIIMAGEPAFPLRASFRYHRRFPILDWEKAYVWVDGLSESQQISAWNELVLGWLAHLGNVMGEDYRLYKQDRAVAISNLSDRQMEVSLQYMNKTPSRIVRVLSGIAQIPQYGFDILILFEGCERYYDYVSAYHPEGEEVPNSSGVFIRQGCEHFAVIASDFTEAEAIIAHEMTHRCLAHLPIPAWVNEGLAVNTEHQLCPPSGSLYRPEEIHELLVKFWNRDLIQEFWSGKSFLRTDNGNPLSYDLAKILVQMLSSNWQAFSDFVCAAHFEDGGQSAALQYLGIDLGVTVAALLEKEDEKSWTPAPELWLTAPERGAF